MFDLDDETQQTFSEEIDVSVLPRSINVENSVPAPSGTVADLSIYEVRFSRLVDMKFY